MWSSLQYSLHSSQSQVGESPTCTCESYASETTTLLLTSEEDGTTEVWDNFLWARPANRSLTTPERARIAWAVRSGEGHRTASFRWFARRLDGPGAEPVLSEWCLSRCPHPEPLGKDFKAQRTSWSKMLSREGVGFGGMGVGGGGGGGGTGDVLSASVPKLRGLSERCPPMTGLG